MIKKLTQDHRDDLINMYEYKPKYECSLKTGFQLIGAGLIYRVVDSNLKPTGYVKLTPQGRIVRLLLLEMSA